MPYLTTLAETAWYVPTLDHVCDGEARQIQQALDVEVVGCLQCRQSGEVAALEVSKQHSTCSALHLLMHSFGYCRA